MTTPAMPLSAVAVWSVPGSPPAAIAGPILPGRAERPALVVVGEVFLEVGRRAADVPTARQFVHWVSPGCRSRSRRRRVALVGLAVAVVVEAGRRPRRWRR